MTPARSSEWEPGDVPVAVIMLALNEAHNLDAVMENLGGWAKEVFLVDSFSKDDTVDIALRHGVHVVQRRFRGFGDQWNFALTRLPVTAPWTMKLDPDERLSRELKDNIRKALNQAKADAFLVTRRWWFMGAPLPIREKLLRVWRTGTCRFSDVTVNEHPLVAGTPGFIDGDLEHFDSPDLEHWFEKQNRYSSAEAINVSTGAPMADVPRFFGTSLQRRMWIKRWFRRLPFHTTVLFFYYWLWMGTWRAGRVGYIAARLWADVWRFRAYKRYEIQRCGRRLVTRQSGTGPADPRVPQFD